MEAYWMIQYSLLMHVAKALISKRISLNSKKCRVAKDKVKIGYAK